MDYEARKQAGEAILNGIPEKLRKTYAGRAKKAPTNTREAIILKCADCCGWYMKEVKECQIKECSLYYLRAKYI